MISFKEFLVETGARGKGVFIRRWQRLQQNAVNPPEQTLDHDKISKRLTRRAKSAVEREDKKRDLNNKITD